MPIIKCKDCGQVIRVKTRIQKRCKECAKKVKYKRPPKEYFRERYNNMYKSVKIDKSLSIQGDIKRKDV